MLRPSLSIIRLYLSQGTPWSDRRLAIAVHTSLVCTEYNKRIRNIPPRFQSLGIQCLGTLFINIYVLITFTFLTPNLIRCQAFFQIFTSTASTPKIPNGILILPITTLTLFNYLWGIVPCANLMTVPLPEFPPDNLSALDLTMCF